MYENKNQPLISRGRFYLRLFYHVSVGIGILCLALGIGVLGYHGFESLSWLDALMNASMILGGMGPVAAIQTDAGKWFASYYAIFSGMLFLGVFGIIIAPILHRFLHILHLDDLEGE